MVRNAADAQLATAVALPGDRRQLARGAARAAGVARRARPAAAFAVGHVAGRGLLPPLRVGRQPYGLLATTAHSRFVPDADDALPAGALGPERDGAAALRPPARRPDARCGRGLDGPRRRRRRLTATDDRVADPARALPAAAGAGGGLVDGVLPLRRQRRGPARRRLARSGAAVRHPAEDPEAPPKSARFGPFALLDATGRCWPRPSASTPAVPLLTDPNRLVHEDWFDAYVRLQDSRAYELRLLDHAHGLRGPSVGPRIPPATSPGVATSTPSEPRGPGRDGGRPVAAAPARPPRAARGPARRRAPHRAGRGPRQRGAAPRGRVVGALRRPVAGQARNPHHLELPARVHLRDRAARDVDLSSPLYTHLQDGHVTLAQSLTGVARRRSGPSPLDARRPRAGPAGPRRRHRARSAPCRRRASARC